LYYFLIIVARLRKSNDPFDKGFDEALAKGWTIVDMKNDWKIIFSFEKK
jgi:hypothetical protein